MDQENRATISDLTNILTGRQSSSQHVVPLALQTDDSPGQNNGARNGALTANVGRQPEQEQLCRHPDPFITIQAHD